jgi:hypothetical protein
MIARTCWRTGERRFSLFRFHSYSSNRRTLVRMASTLPNLPLFKAIASHDPHKTAVVHSVSGRNFTYGSLLQDVAKARDQLHRSARGNPLNGQRVAFLIENGYDYVGANCSHMPPKTSPNLHSDSSFNPLKRCNCCAIVTSFPCQRT